MFKTRENQRFSVNKKTSLKFPVSQKSQSDFLGSQKFSRKSQAALEFLMTYGWAILVVLVAVGALAYFGVLSPDRFLPSKCTLSAGIACLDHRAEPGQIQVVIQNSLGYDIDTVSVVSANDASTCGPDSSTASLANGAKATYTLTCAPAITGSKYSGALNVSYRIIETQLSHKNQGQITTKIE